MLEDYYVRPSTLDRIRASWLAPQIESYLEWLEIHGYSRLVVYRRVPLLFHCFLQGLYKGVRLAVVGATRSQDKDSDCDTQACDRRRVSAFRAGLRQR
jgi:hypothetical protein